MEDRETKIKSIIVIILAWLFALAMVYIVIVKIKFFAH
jgi:hypothetical protein